VSDKTEQCKHNVYADWHTHQCPRKAWKDGYCKQHHPDTIAERDRKRREKWERESAANRKVWALQSAAPDLLEACKAALRDRFGWDDPCVDRDPITNVLRAAIAKAEGKP